MRALDLFCGGGGVAEGLQDAGFETVVGIDSNPRCGRYYPGTFVCRDVLSLRASDLHGYDFVWASPPCQAWSRAAMTSRRRDNPKLIDFIRRLLARHPYTCIENVPEAPLRHDLVLTGPMVGLYRITRARAFEISWFTLQPSTSKTPDPAHSVTITKSLSHPQHYYKRVRQGLPGRLPVEEARQMLPGRLPVEEARQIMGIRHAMPGYMVGEAIPPAMAAWVVKSALQNGMVSAPARAAGRGRPDLRSLRRERSR